MPATATDAAGLVRVLLASYDVDIDWLEHIIPPDVPVSYVGNPPPGDQRGPSGLPPGFYPSSTKKHWEMGVPRKPHPRAVSYTHLRAHET